MSFSPAHAPQVSRVTSALPPRHGGNLARPNQIRTGHFLFQSPDHIGGGIPDPYEAEAASLRPASGRARRQNRPLIPAKSRTFPFPQVNDISHSVFLSFSSRTRELMENGLHAKCKRLWQKGN